MDIEFSKIISTNHGFFGKRVEESNGIFDSLNCSSDVVDENAEKNILKVQRYFKASKIILLKQIHSNKCITDEEKNLNADAIVTNKPNILIGVYTADCIPLLFFEEERKIIGAAHAGWKGARLGIIESTIEKILSLSGDIKNIKVALGPSIKRESYEVREDFIKNFENDKFFNYKDGKLFFDVVKYSIEKLLRQGIQLENIEEINIDTYINSDYFSYRRALKFTRGVCGRNLSCIML